MRNLSIRLAVAAVATIAATLATGALAALAQRTFVRSDGADANTCSIAQPCRSFTAALGKTAAAGEIIVLDSAGYGPVIINQSVAIIAPSGIYAGVSVFSDDGVTVNGDATANVVLRGLTINGLGGEDYIDGGPGTNHLHGGAGFDSFFFRTVHGIDIINAFTTGVDEQYSAAALPQRVMQEDSADGVLYVVLGAKIAEVRATPGVTEIANADLRTDAERAHYDQLHAFLVRRFTELGRPDLAAQLDSQAGSAGLLFIQPPLPPDVAGAVSELVSLRLPASVFLVPPGTAVPALGIEGGR